MKLSRYAGATALASTLFLVAPAFGQATPNTPNPAQPAPKTAPQAAEQAAQTVSADGQSSDDGAIVVTGSRIARPETDGVLPGVQITAQSIETRGFTNALEALNDIPLVGPGASPLNGNNGGQTASLGAAFVDLLDLGTARTLTLVNGRRFVSGNAASLFVAGNETGSQVDVNVIPSTLIQRVDVVTVGGAAAYGADAIAGVVNYILKDDYDGVQLRGLAGISERGDAGQFQLSALAGRNFFDGRANLTASFEYSRNDGLQAVSRDFRNVRPGSYTNPFNGGIRNPSFTGRDVIDATATGLNNGAFLAAATDGQPSTLYGLGLVTQTLSNPGTILNVQSNTFYTPYTPITTGSGTTLRTSNYITFANGAAPVGFALPATNATGGATTISSLNNGFFSFSAAQIIKGTPGSDVTFGTLSGNGLNGSTTQATNVPFTTFAPTALPSNVTSAQVLAAYGVTAPTGSTAAQQTTLAINLLQANRFTSREFLAANPTTNINYFIGTFDPAVPRIANTDTTLVNVKVNGATVQVPVNQVLPFVAVPLEFNDDGSIRRYNFSGPVSGNSPITVGSARGGDGGFRRSLENTVLRTQQDRYVANLMGKFDITDNITFFSEGTYAKVLNRSLGNISGAQNFITNTQENSALLLNYNNPFLDASDRAALTAVGIAPNQANAGNFLLTRQNQDIFGANPYTNRQETYRIVAGLRSNFELFGKRWKAEVSGTYGNSEQNTRSDGIADLEYQLALDAVDQGLATTGVANGNIVCRSQVFPSQYLGRTPIGTATNITRVVGADGIPTEVIVTPTITQDLITACKPLNPFGYNQMSAESKAYVTSPSLFRNVSKQTFIQGSLSGGLFDLPAGALQFNANGEYRKDELTFTTNQLNILGRSRSAPSANTAAYTETYEFGGELAIPLTGPDFLSFLGRLEFNPAFRMSKQSGQAATYRNLQGTTITPKADGDWGTIYSLAGTWKPLQDIQFRGNYTRSLRQPSIVELFLGGQPTFQAVTDLCGPASIDTGVVPTTRRANCVAAALANGNFIGSNDAAGATEFLRNFVPQGGSLQGTFSGSTGLAPEKGKSWTAGGVLTPRWIPGLTLSADYINVRVDNTIVTAGVGTFLQACYDSPTFPDSSAQIGINGCSRFARGSDFQLQNGVQAGFLNLGAIKIRAMNMSGNYAFGIGSGRMTLRANAYHLIQYDTSASGTFNGDRVMTAGTFSRSKLETQLSARYEREQFYTQVTWNRQAPTRVFSSGLPATTEIVPYNRYPALHNIDLALGVDVNEKFRMQFNVSNVLDQTTGGDLGYRFADYYDQIGRRFQVAVTTRY
ncbi:TonB-dependent receptor [Sphingomonas donggukensis]|uniref:TonB-dependent receptor n=1 Tax=Sphingomonas donggukensis TaxID=2949093 RepID=A0ABY4TU64_9SPHN|nr:TonB-dependent receptor [Sphingomonas donggukensis]URW75932.1 TonB-dependent receptor [Sphingomonas donggukensis]